jgi:hypothetical protein
MSDAAQPYSFSLGTFAEPSTFNLLIDITEAEYESIHEAFVAVARLSASFDYKLVARNFVDLEHPPVRHDHDISRATVCLTGSPAARRVIHGLNGELAHIYAAIPRPH